MNDKQDRRTFMAENKSEGGGSPALNLNSLLALLTLAGSVWLVSNKLTSDRPVASAGGTREFMGEQTLEARLWEDPFKTGEEQRGSYRSGEAKTNLNTLVEQIWERSRSTNRVLLFPVMLSGGHYSEDQESRIRSRFAIVSALGRSGYAPEDAEHIGALDIPWPTQHEVDEVKDQSNPNLNKSNLRTLWEALDKKSSRMYLRYEWYRARMFSPRSSNTNLWPSVLVLWVDDSYFEDEPLLRLPLLLEPLTETSKLQMTDSPQVALIGPRRSSTLRAMLPNWQSGTTPLSNASNTNLWRLATNVLRRIKVYCATPSAMDEVLVKHPNATPRESVGHQLMTNGFNSFQNFAATDAQLKAEIYSYSRTRGDRRATRQRSVCRIVLGPHLSD